MSTYREKHPKALLLGLFDTAIATAHCLRPLGIRIIGVDFDLRLSGFSSRSLKPFLIPHPPEEERKAVDFIIALIRQESGKVIAIPTSDYFVRLLSKYREEFGACAAFLIPDADSIEMIIQRGRQFEAARSAGLAVPDYLNGPVTLERIIDMQWPFPLAVKPSNIIEWKKHFDNKGFVVNGPEELRQALSGVNAHTEAYLVQKVIPGDTSNNFEVNALYLPDGRLIQHTIRKVRQYPDLFGTATCIQNYPHEQLEQMAARFITENKLYGFTNLEFKFSGADQAYYYIETNIRVWLQINFSKSMGYNFAHIYYAYLAGLPIAGRAPENKLKKGKWVDFVPDILFWVKYRIKYGLSLPALVKSWLPLKVANLFSLSDPWPFLKELKLVKRFQHLLKM
ncbi:MAG: hypothetical protein H6564_10730 [Lewinellaceae bacterium]|nr:hypothetical protein [Lewinellaceae bacterium]